MDYASSLLGLLPGGRRTPGLKELLAAVSSYLPAEQVARIREAAEFGASAHKGQKRLSGEPYIAHPVAAASILADLHLDHGENGLDAVNSIREQIKIDVPAVIVTADYSTEAEREAAVYGIELLRKPIKRAASGGPVAADDAADGAGAAVVPRRTKGFPARSPTNSPRLRIRKRRTRLPISTAIPRSPVRPTFSPNLLRQPPNRWPRSVPHRKWRAPLR